MEDLICLLATVRTLKVVDILIQICSLFWLSLPYQFCEKRDQWIIIIMVSKIWGGMSTTNIHIYIRKNADFECRYIRTHIEERKTSNITMAILQFLIKTL